MADKIPVTEEDIDRAAVELARRLIVLVHLREIKETIENPPHALDARLAGLKNRLREDLRNLSR